VQSNLARYTKAMYPEGAVFEGILVATAAQSEYLVRRPLL